MTDHLFNDLTEVSNTQVYSITLHGLSFLGIISIKYCLTTLDSLTNRHIITYTLSHCPSDNNQGQFYQTLILTKTTQTIFSLSVLGFADEFFLIRLQI